MERKILSPIKKNNQFWVQNVAFCCQLASFMDSFFRGAAL